MSLLKIKFKRPINNYIFVNNFILKMKFFFNQLIILLNVSNQ